MPVPQITYTFVAGTTINSGEVNQNNSDIINGLTDGLKDLTINALTVNGVFVARGNITLGNASTDVISTEGTFDKILMNNGATDGGAIYFDGALTSFIKSSADGATLTVDGFTTTDVSATALTVGVVNPVVTIGDGTGTSTDPSLVINSNTGDAALQLKVNNNASNAWIIRNDNSDSDNLRIEFASTGLGGVKSTGGAFFGNSAVTATGGNTLELISGTGDAGISLALNDAAANTWEIYGDNSDSDKFSLAYNGSRVFDLQTSGLLTLQDGLTPKASSGIPAANTLYQQSIVKAWGLLTCGAAGSVTLTASFNINSASYTGSGISIDWDRDFSSSEYVVIAQFASASSADVFLSPYRGSAAWNAGTAVVLAVTETAGTIGARNFASGDKVMVIAIGAQ